MSWHWRPAAAARAEPGTERGSAWPDGHSATAPSAGGAGWPDTHTHTPEKRQKVLHGWQIEIELLRNVVLQVCHILAFLNTRAKLGE